MKSIKIIAVALVLFAALAFGISKQVPVQNTAEETTHIAPHKLNGPIGMSDDDQF